MALRLNRVVILVLVLALVNVPPSTCAVIHENSSSNSDSRETHNLTSRIAIMGRTLVRIIVSLTALISEQAEKFANHGCLTNETVAGATLVICLGLVALQGAIFIV